MQNPYDYHPYIFDEEEKALEILEDNSLSDTQKNDKIVELIASLCEERETLKAQLSTCVEDTCRKIVNTHHFEVDGHDFYYNEPNNYGTITVKFLVGDGDPFKNYAGEKCYSNYRDGIRHNGNYKLNENFVQWLKFEITK